MGADGLAYLFSNLCTSIAIRILLPGDLLASELNLKGYILVTLLVSLNPFRKSLVVYLLFNDCETNSCKLWWLSEDIDYLLLYINKLFLAYYYSCLFNNYCECIYFILVLLKLCLFAFSTILT